MRTAADAGRAALALTLLAAIACGGDDAPRPAGPDRPNVLLVVWDTVRADRMSLYGYPKPTTPLLEAWARGARVFTDALAPANSTVPSHASLFTGLLPSEHGSHARHQYLDDQHTTLAELFRTAGYRTFLWAANPHLSDSENFTQGFERVRHPWDEGNREAAIGLVRAKLPAGSPLRSRLDGDEGAPGLLKSAGALAERNAVEFLESGDGSRPWFAVINYMEAHRQVIPPPRHRAIFLETPRPDDARPPPSWRAVWSHVFGVERLAPAVLRRLGADYDAALRELDDLFAALLASFEARGWLDDAVVVLTSDHGELLGEHGLLDHQYSLYRPLLQVPLVLHHPERVPPGRSDAPVMVPDLFPTLVELSGLAPPDRRSAGVASLLDPPRERDRLSEYPAVFDRPLETVRKHHPGFDPTPWQRRLRALRAGSLRLIEGEDGALELYDVERDPGEERNLAADRPEQVTRMQQRLFETVRALSPALPPGAGPTLDDDERRMLEELGYCADCETADAPAFDAETSWNAARDGAS